MSDFLARLAERTLGLALPVEPILASRYEPSQDLAAAGAGPPTVSEAPVGATVLPAGSGVAAPGGLETEWHASAASGPAFTDPLVSSPDGEPSATTAEPPSHRERTTTMFAGTGVAGGDPEGSRHPQSQLGGSPASDARAGRRMTARPPDRHAPTMPRESGHDVPGAARGESEAMERPRATRPSLPQAAPVAAAGTPIRPEPTVTDAQPVFAATRDLEPRPASSDVGPNSRAGHQSPARPVRAGAEAERAGSEPGHKDGGDREGERLDGSGSEPATADSTRDAGREGRGSGGIPSVVMATGRVAAADLPARQPAPEVGAAGHLVPKVNESVAAHDAAPQHRAAARANAILHDPGSSPAGPPAPLTTAALAEQARPIVQVTIGRIEVRAVSSPPAPQPEPAPAGPRVGLEDYLRERNGGRR